MFAGLAPALLVLLMLGTGARADTPKLSDAQTVAYIVNEYKTGASRPDLNLAVQFRSPHLRITWQQENTDVESGAKTVSTEEIQINVEYAKFDIWNDGADDLNTVIVDCAEEYLCYVSLPHRERHSHGDLDYLIRTYAGRRIVQALNYLASQYSDARPKNPYDMTSVAPSPDVPQKNPAVR